ncbi:hypothetical protein AGMMS50293_07970 [Spirochaetia bacterium]|nr:hypothetical protein AGMMS50293_07970 [Spirochaetia bacterium]
MIKILTAYTREANNPEKAVQEIQEQLNFEQGLCRNSVALLFCYTEFVQSGAMEAVSKSLPCEVLGCTSQYFAIKEAVDENMLVVNILTSDDTEFATGLSEPLDIGNVDACIHTLYQKTAAALDAEPALIFALQPLMFSLSGDIIAAALDRACGGLPVFGTRALDAEIQIRNPQTIYQGAAYDNRMTLLLFKGAVKARFFSVPFPARNVFDQDAVVTGAEGNNIITINNIPAISFLEDLGLIQNDLLNILYVIPLVVDYHNGAPPEIVLIDNIVSGGALHCSRKVQTGVTLNIGSITADYVLESANALAQEIKKAGSETGLFIFSCFNRNVVLVGDPLEEAELIQKALVGFSAPYLFMYSGGELCPQELESGKTVNRYHQFAIIACLL